MEATVSSKNEDSQAFRVNAGLLEMADQKQFFGFREAKGTQPIFVPLVLRHFQESLAAHPGRP